MTPEEFAEVYLQPEFRRFFLTSFRNAQVEPLDYEHFPAHYDLSLLNRFYKREGRILFLTRYLY